MPPFKAQSELKSKFIVVKCPNVTVVHGLEDLLYGEYIWRALLSQLLLKDRQDFPVPVLAYISPKLVAVCASPNFFPQLPPCFHQLASKAVSMLSHPGTQA